jgi:hypothetical protein
MDFRNTVDEALAWARGWFDYGGAPWFFYQTGIIVGLAASRIEPLLENRARQIKGHPGLLRVIVALLRRTDWVLFTVFLLAAVILLRGITWPSRSYIISIALSFVPGVAVRLRAVAHHPQSASRAHSWLTRDGREYLIPNEDFITQRVINWTFRDDLVRLDVEFGVSYDADPHRVSQLAIQAALTVPRVEADRRPVCWLTAFGGSSLDFVLRFWVHEPQQGLTNMRGKVLLALWDTFKENGIGIPYPHREIIMKQGFQSRPVNTG